MPAERSRGAGGGQRKTIRSTGKKGSTATGGNAERLLCKPTFLVSAYVCLTFFFTVRVRTGGKLPKGPRLTWPEFTGAWTERLFFSSDRLIVPQ